MYKHSEISSATIKRHYKNGYICFAGNIKLRIYGTMKCKSGKRMKTENRVFFSSEKEAVENGFRPCGHCLKLQYNLLTSQNPF
jgi:methylphosphotriester-DNA--protein-cysteine methyltransferase